MQGRGTRREKARADTEIMDCAECLGDAFLIVHDADNVFEFGAEFPECDNRHTIPLCAFHFRHSVLNAVGMVLPPECF